MPITPLEDKRFKRIFTQKADQQKEAAHTCRHSGNGRQTSENTHRVGRQWLNGIPSIGRAVINETARARIPHPDLSFHRERYWIERWAVERWLCRVALPKAIGPGLPGLTFHVEETV